jgi:predicted aconitase with swiveling domain
VAAGRILALPYARGSSTTTAVLLEAVRAGTAPAALLTTGEDTFFALAAIVAEEMFGRGFPVIRVEAPVLARLVSGAHARVATDGTIRLDGDTAAPSRPDPVDG